MFNCRWQPDVPSRLREGILFDRVDEDSGSIDTDLTIGVDEHGFFIWYKTEKVNSE